MAVLGRFPVHGSSQTPPPDRRPRTPASPGRPSQRTPPRSTPPTAPRPAAINARTTAPNTASGSADTDDDDAAVQMTAHSDPAADHRQRPAAPRRTPAPTAPTPDAGRSTPTPRRSPDTPRVGVRPGRNLPPAPRNGSACRPRTRRALTVHDPTRRERTLTGPALPRAPRIRARPILGTHRVSLPAEEVHVVVHGPRTRRQPGRGPPLNNRGGSDHVKIRRPCRHPQAPVDPGRPCPARPRQQPGSSTPTAPDPAPHSRTG